MRAYDPDLSLHELQAEAVDVLPERAALASLLGGSLFDTGNLASLIGGVGDASGNADQTAPIVQGLGSTPTIPAMPAL
jgi:hypothetical protein